LGERIAKQLSGSWNSFVSGGASFLVWFIGALPFLLFWGAIIFVGVFVGRRTVKKRRAAAQKKQDDASER
jgi:hypothetical protein